MRDFVVPNNDDDASEEYVLDMMYDNAGCMILDDPPCLEIATTVCEDTLIHESSILFFNSPNHTTEGKYARVEILMCFSNILCL
jgi:hypothetical protein